MVFRVAEKLPVPFVSIEFAGRRALASVLVKCTIPEYAVTVLFEASSAVTVKLKSVPAVAEAGAVTEK